MNHRRFWPESSSVSDPRLVQDASLLARGTGAQRNRRGGPLNRIWWNEDVTEAISRRAAKIVVIFLGLALTALAIPLAKPVFWWVMTKRVSLDGTDQVALLRTL